MKLAIYETEIRRKRRIASPGRVSSPQEAAWVCRDMATLDREHLVRLDLDTRNNLIGRETVHIGTSDSAIISPRDILRGAILNGAVKIIIAHNHPSGDPSPSKEDIIVTERMGKASDMVGITLVDSLIIGQDGRYYSCPQRSGGTIRDLHRHQAKPKQQTLLRYR